MAFCFLLSVAFVRCWIVRTLSLCSTYVRSWRWTLHVFSIDQTLDHPLCILDRLSERSGNAALLRLRLVEDAAHPSEVSKYKGARIPLHTWTCSQAWTRTLPSFSFIDRLARSNTDSLCLFTDSLTCSFTDSLCSFTDSLTCSFTDSLLHSPTRSFLVSVFRIRRSVFDLPHLVRVAIPPSVLFCCFFISRALHQAVAADELHYSCLRNSLFRLGWTTDRSRRGAYYRVTASKVNLGWFGFGFA
jgi:hypothetical protein